VPSGASARPRANARRHPFDDIGAPLAALGRSHYATRASGSDRRLSGAWRRTIPLALFAFNLGVEVGQLAFIGAVLGIIHLGKLLPILTVAGNRLRTAMGYGIGTAAAFWFVERLTAF
jgi:hypothetical protein